MIPPEHTPSSRTARVSTVRPAPPGAAECFVYRYSLGVGRGRGGRRRIVWNSLPDARAIETAITSGALGEGAFRLEWRDARRRILRVDRCAHGAPRRRAPQRVGAPTASPPRGARGEAG